MMIKNDDIVETTKNSNFAKKRQVIILHKK